MSGTTGTPRTQSYLLTTEFQDGQASGAIAPLRMRDLIASIPGNSTLFNVINIGAIGNGSSNPASTVYGSLSALRAVYGATVGGVTIALTNELDWISTQKAIDIATSSGGVIYSPPASYVYANSNSVSDGSGTLVFPSAAIGAAAVSWRCDTGAIHHWTTDLGSGRSAVFCTGRGTGASSYGFFTGLNLVGPGCGSTFGSTTCSMQGIMTGDRREITNSYINGFKVGVNIVGGQFTHIEVYCVSCYHGFYLDTPDPSNFGNFIMIHCAANSSLLAAFAVHHAAAIAGCTFTQCFFGTAPYSIYKETNSGSPTQPIVTSGTQFVETQFEGFGNALITDDQAHGSKVVQVYQTDLIRCQMCWDTYLSLNFHLPGGTAYAVFDVHYLTDFNILDPIQPQQIQPGTTGIIYCNNVVSVTWRGDMQTVFNNCINAISPQVNNFVTTNGSPNIKIINTGIYYYEGTVGESVSASEVVGSMLVQDTNNFNNTALSAGTTADVGLGVMMYNPNPSGAFSQVVFANKGNVTVACSGTVTVGQILRTHSGGLVVAAANSADLTSPIVGFSSTASSGGFCEMMIQGLD